MDDADDFFRKSFFFENFVVPFFCNLNIFKVKRTRFSHMSAEIFLGGSVQNVKKSSFE